MKGDGDVLLQLGPIRVVVGEIRGKVVRLRTPEQTTLPRISRMHAD